MDKMAPSKVLTIWLVGSVALLLIAPLTVVLLHHFHWSSCTLNSGLTNNRVKIGVLVYDTLLCFSMLELIFTIGFVFCDRQTLNEVAHEDWEAPTQLVCVECSHINHTTQPLPTGQNKHCYSIQVANIQLESEDEEHYDL